MGYEEGPEGLGGLESDGGKFGFKVEWKELDWSCERYLHTGMMMPPNGIETLQGFDAIFLGAVGHPKVADHVSLWGLLIPIRRHFQQYVNLRPVRLSRQQHAAPRR